ncbi:MAG: DEAD/DEAH box helicase, partial [Acidimicrobiales bacterium]
MTGADRRGFVAGLGFALDPFQIQAMDAIDAGDSVLVAAPTGSGKTVVGEYVLYRARTEGAKAFYTTPLKALSNQKFGDFGARFGQDHVGLLTGDNSIRGEAPLVVMTTEVLRNMLYARSPTLDGLQFVVLDEVHYLENAWRGPVWEEVIIHAPPHIQLVCLSATVSNAGEVADWLRSVRGAATSIIEERRPVELTNLYLAGDRRTRKLALLPMFAKQRPNPRAAELGKAFTPRRVPVVELLDAKGMLPAIYFVFSRAGCDEAVRTCRREGVRLTTEAEDAAIAEIAHARAATLTPSDREVLGYDAWLAGLRAGVAAHHAGLVPPFKEAVEICFAQGLVKVVFATETLALGINMPAKSVVIENLSKFNGESHELLRPGEYTQLTGRAGRRGIDSVGYAVVLWSQFVPFHRVAALASARSYELTSAFRPTYNMTANLVRRYTPDEAHHVLHLSFAQFRAGENSLAVEFDRVLQVLERWGYVEGWHLTDEGQRLA